MCSFHNIFSLTWHRNLTNIAFLHSTRTVFIVLHTAMGKPTSASSCYLRPWANCRDFDSLAAALAGHFRVVCMDVVGRGASDWLEHKEDYGFGLYLSDAASLLALVAHEKRAGPLAKLIRRPTPQRSPFIDWIGTSMGGLIGMMLAARSNSPIRHLVLNDVGPFISWQALGRLKKLHTRRSERFDDLKEVQDYIRDVCAEFGPLSEEQWAHVAQHSVQPSENGGYELAWDPAILNALRINTRDRMAFGSEFLLGFDLWPIWNAVRCPTLVLRGSKSAVLSAATAKRMRKSGPRAQVIDIEGVGHAPWLMSEDQIRIVRDLNAGAIIPHCSDRVIRLRRSKNPAADSLLPSIRQRARDEGRGSLFEGAACGSN